MSESQKPGRPLSLLELLLEVTIPQAEDELGFFARRRLPVEEIYDRLPRDILADLTALDPA
jgi:hypothetical protein